MSAFFFVNRPDGVGTVSKEMGWGDALPFGKYRGLLIREVASFNPQYLAWAANNIDGFALSQEARKLGQRELNRHREQAFQRQNGWAHGFGREVKAAASAWRLRMCRLERAARNAADERDRDRDASLAEDAKRLSPEGVAARAEGIAQPPIEEQQS